MIKHIWLSLLIVLISALGITAQAATRITYLHHDNLGSPVAATDESGAVLWRETYAPFGDKSVKSESATNERIGYTGKLHDNDTGLTYLNARYYDPVLGRFMAVDTVGALTGGAGHFNRYSYAYNNPYKYTDPTGFLGMCGGACGDSPAGFDPETDWEKTRLERANNMSDFIVGLTPWGTLVDTFGAIYGFNPITGEELSPLERAIGVVPGVSEAKKVSKLNNWKPLDIMDPDNWNGCEKCARYIRRQIGGDIYRIEANAPALGKYRDKNTGWAHHDVVVKDGRVYDAFGPAEGVPIDKFKDLFEYSDVINFGF